MKETLFFVEIGQQSPILNRFMDAADLGIKAAIIPDGSGFDVTVTWKEGEIVDNTRIEKVQQAIKDAYERMGFCVLGISVKPPKGERNETSNLLGITK